MSEIRTRFAPSPTGWMHIGNLRTALYAYLFAKSNEGTFILRVEDTDKKREVEGSVDFIYNCLKMAGMTWDEGPDVGGDFGPYIQSDRMDLYKEYAHKLVELGGGYYCFCSAEIERAKDEKDPCRNLDYKEAKARVDAGESFVVRQKIEPGEEITYHDVVFGSITFNTSDLDEGVMLKSDGYPTYNFANVVDDHLMNISHVMRGYEYISSTPKYELLYRTFSWKTPKYIHVTHIMKDKHNKLSKRDGSGSFMDLIDKGYLPEAIVNYVILLGWHPKDDREIFTLDELKKVFNKNGFQKSPAIFDWDKLNWMNGQYVHKLFPEEFHKRALEFYPKELKGLDLEYLSTVLHKRTDYFGQIPELVDFLVEMPEFSPDLYVNEKLQSTLEITKDSIEKIIPILENLEDWTESNIKDAMFGLVNEMGLKNGQVLWPLRIALSGKEFTPGGPIEIAMVLGKEETLRRFRLAGERLG